MVLVLSFYKAEVKISTISCLDKAGLPGRLPFSSGVNLIAVSANSPKWVLSMSTSLKRTGQPICFRNSSYLSTPLWERVSVLPWIQALLWRNTCLFKGLRCKVAFNTVRFIRIKGKPVWLSLPLIFLSSAVNLAIDNRCLVTFFQDDAQCSGSSFKVRCRVIGKNIRDLF